MWFGWLDGYLLEVKSVFVVKISQDNYVDCLKLLELMIHNSNIETSGTTNEDKSYWLLKCDQSINYDRDNVDVNLTICLRRNIRGT